MFWDLIQDSPVGSRRDRTGSVERRTLTLEKRILLLEEELRQTQDLLVRLVERLEERWREDIDGDGGIGTVGGRKSEPDTGSEPGLAADEGEPEG